MNGRRGFAVTDDVTGRFELLYRQHFRAVLRYALARVEPESAKDVTAETFLIAWRRLPDVPADAAPWLFGVARKVIAGQLRSDHRREALYLRLDAVVGRSAGSGSGSGSGDVGDEVSQRDTVLTALARLGETDREVLRLIAWDGLSSKAAAEVLGVTRLAFGVRLHRARRRFAAALDAVETTAPAQRPEPDPPPSRHASPFTRATEVR
jgi:RNA polymerase sigma-70 factor, ECF subfamily